MASSTVFLRRVASSVTPLAIRVTCTQRNYCSALFTPLKKNSSSLSEELFRRTSLPIFQFSSLAKKPSSDQSLLRVIDIEIKCAEESESHDRVKEEIPNGFPFELQDNPGEQTVSLRREFQGEIIKVEVQMPSFDTGDEENDEDDENDEDAGDNDSIPLVVSISKGAGTCLEFACTAYPDEISIDCLSVKKPDASEDENTYEGPDFSDLDENMQKAFQKYLEVRGIKPSTIKILQEYMIKKESREYLMWLKSVKKFIEN